MPSPPKTVETVLRDAVDELRSRQGLDVWLFIDRHREHEKELRRYLPTLTSCPPEMVNRALAVDGEGLTMLCDLLIMVRGG